VNEFVEECRREWKRFGVPDPVADQMAEELAADLDEAEAEGASREDVLGTRALDARSFAINWAAERGVMRWPPPSGRRLLRRSLVPAATAAFTVIAIVGAVLVIPESASGPQRLVLPPPSARLVARDPIPAPAPAVWIGPGDRVVVVAGPVEDSGDTRTVGSVLLIVGLAGVMLLTLFRWWVGSGRRSLRTGPAH
jgi:hypothetical protein